MRGKVTIEISNTTPLPAKVYAGEGRRFFFSATRFEDQLRRQGRQVPGPGRPDPSVRPKIRLMDWCDDVPMAVADNRFGTNLNGQMNNQYLYL